MSDDHRWHLACPFLTGSDEFARGVEVGMAWSQMQRRRTVTGYFLRANEDQILLMASRLGFDVLQRESHDADWLYLVLRRRHAAPPPGPGT